MKLTQLAAKPQLVKLTIDDEAILDKYGEAIEFWIYDRQDMDTFMELASLDENNFAKISNLVQKMILDENGKQVIADGNTLPVDILIKVVEKVVKNLGNVVNQTTVA